MKKKISAELISGDALSQIKKLDENSVNLILTDPPYNLGLFMKSRSTNLSALRENHFSGKGWDHLPEHEWSKQMEVLFEELSRVLKDGGSLIMFMAIIKLETIINK